MTVVVDASAVVRWLIAADGADEAAAIYSTHEVVVAPDLIIPEIANAFWKYVTFDGGSIEKANAAIAESASLFNEIIPSVELKDRAFSIAMELQHPIYDCFYLALAEQRNCQLVTADRRLVRRCARTRFAKRLKPLVGAQRGRRR